MNDGGQDSGTGERWAADLANMPTFSPTHPGGPAIVKSEEVAVASGKYWVRPEKQDGATGYAVLRGDVLVAAPPYYSKDPRRIKELQIQASEIASSLAWRDVTIAFAESQIANGIEQLVAAIMAEDEAEGGDSWRSTERYADLVGRTAREP